MLINNPPQDVIQTRIQQYSFLKNTAILTCFSCPAALLLFSGKRQPRRQALWPLCSALLSWLKPQGSLYLVMHSLSQSFGEVCDNLFIYRGYFISTFQPVFVFWCISRFIIKDSTTFVATLYLHNRVLQKKNTYNQKYFVNVSANALSSGRVRYCMVSEPLDFLPP